MKKLLLATGIILGLTGCSSSVQQMDERLTDEARIYSKTKAVYCGSSTVMTYYESEDFISVSCEDGSTKTVFFD